MEDDLKVAVALLRQEIANLTKEVSSNDSRNDKRIEKIEGSIRWGALLVIGMVISQLLKVAGISP